MTAYQQGAAVYTRGNQGPPGPGNVQNVKASYFGAKGDGVTDDTAAIQSAINAAATVGGVVYLPHGTYRITSTLTVCDDDEHGHQTGVRFLGDNAGADKAHANRTVIAWDGASTSSPMLGLYSRGCIVEKIHFDVKSGRTAKCAVSATRASGTNAGSCTYMIFRYLRIGNDLGGTMTDGIIGGDLVNGVYPPNCEAFRFENCYFSLCAHAGVYVPNTTGQSKSHAYYRCDFSGGQYGLYYKSGSFHTDCTGFGQITVCAIYAEQTTDVLTIKSCDSEGCKQFLLTGTAASSWPIHIMGGRLGADTSILGPTDIFIRSRNQGPLMMQGTLIETTNFSNAFVIVDTAVDTANSSSKMVLIGCSFSINGTIGSAGVNRQRRLILGCTWVNSDGTAGIMDDQIYDIGTNSDGSWSKYRLRIGNAYLTNNLMGNVTISAAATTAAVSFALPEVDTSYNVLVGLDTITGAFTPGTVWVSSKTTSGFTINISAAPGGSNTAKINWVLTRGS